MQKVVTLLLLFLICLNTISCQRRRNFHQHRGGYGNRGRRNFQNNHHGPRLYQQQLYQRFSHEHQPQVMNMYFYEQPLIAQNNCRYIQFRKQTDDQIYGSLLLDVGRDKKETDIEIEFDRPVVGFINNLTPSTSDDNRIFMIKDSKKKEENEVEFVVNFNQGLPPPIMIRLKFNGKELCPAFKMFDLCADFEMINNGTRGQYDAILTIYFNQIFNGAKKIDLKFDSKSQALVNDLGESVTMDQKHFTIFNNKIIEQDQALRIAIMVKYDEFEDIPKLMNLYVDEIPVCLPHNKNLESIKRSNFYSTQTSQYNRSESNMLLSDLPFKSFPNVINSLQQVDNSGFECGLAGNVITTRVNDGLTAHLGQFPFHAAIFYHLRYRCGASLITEKVSVSASHCVVDSSQKTLPAENFHLLFGTIDLQSLSGNEALRHVAQIVKHPNYQHEKILKQDIAVLVIKGNLQFTQYIRPICLPFDLGPISKNIQKNLTVIGFGSSTESLKLSRFLHYGKMTVISREKCTEKLILALLPEHSTFCAIANNNMLACPGDSGGGIIEIIKGKFYLRGIASVTLTDANGRCNAENPVGFTDVMAFIMWLKENGIDTQSN